MYVEMRNICKNYGDFKASDNVSSVSYTHLTLPTIA